MGVRKWVEFWKPMITPTSPRAVARVRSAGEPTSERKHPWERSRRFQPVIQRMAPW